MNDDNKRKFVEEYNAANTLYDHELIDAQKYDEINRILLRTIIARFAMELNKEEKKDE